MDDCIDHDPTLFRGAIAQVKSDLIQIAKRIDRPRSAVDVVNTATELRAISERFENLARGILDLQSKVCV